MDGGGAHRTLGEKTGWFGALRWRYISSRPLHRGWRLPVAADINTFNADVGYRFANGWRVQVDALNLLNSTTYNASYAYGALLTTDALFAKCFPTPKIPLAVCQNGFHGLFDPPHRAHGFPAYARRTARYDRCLRNGREFGRAIPTFAPPSRNYDWTGFYVGGYGEYSWASTNGGAVNLATGAAATPVTGNLPNWRGGLQLGFDYMMPSRLLIGVAADVTSGGTKTTTITDASGTSANQTTVFDSETVRGRFGYAVDNVLLYGTAGWAWSSNQYVRTQLTGTLNNATAGADEAVNKYLGGWTAGAGVSVAVAQNWNVFAEYRYTSYGSTAFTLPLSELSTTSTTKVSAIEFGVNYKFNGGAPFAPVSGVAGIGLPPVKAPGVRSPYDSDRFLLRSRRRLCLAKGDRDFDDGVRRCVDAIRLQRHRAVRRKFYWRKLSIQSVCARR